MGIFLPFDRTNTCRIMTGQGVEDTDQYYKSSYLIWLLYGDTYRSGGVTSPKISIECKDIWYSSGSRLENDFYYTDGYYVRPVCK